MKPLDDRREVEAALTHHYGVPPHAIDHLRLFETDGDRLYAAADALADVDVLADARVRVERVGLYLASWTDEGLRLSMEGAELLAPAAEPVYEVSREDARAWLAGENLPIHGVFTPTFLILTHDDMVLGCGVVLGEEIRNRVPKQRRIARDATILR